METTEIGRGGIEHVWFRVLFIGSLGAAALVSLPILFLGPGMPLALLTAVPFIVLARFAWPRGWTSRARHAP